MHFSRAFLSLVTQATHSRFLRNHRLTSLIYGFQSLKTTTSLHNKAETRGKPGIEWRLGRRWTLTTTA